MAQALLQRRLQHEAGWTGEGYRVLSAGLFTEDGHPASRDAVRVMGEEGIDLTSHGSVQLKRSLAGEVDLILTMTENQRDYVRQECPAKADCTFTINEFTGGQSGEVSDPYGLGLNAYRACRTQLKILVDELFNKIIESKMR